MNFLDRIRSMFAGPRRQRPDLVEMSPGHGRQIRARYDAAQTTTDMGNHWAATDALDADTANSLNVRKRLRERARYEIANNSDAKGMVLTHANYIVGRGPKLRLQSGNPNINAKVEAAWQTWSKAVGLAAKLRTMCMAKTGDGEAFALIGTNPRLADPVQLDLKLVECDQITTPNLTAGEPGRIDGMKFDGWGNPESYDLLTEHPGSPAARDATLARWRPSSCCTGTAAIGPASTAACRRSRPA